MIRNYFSDLELDPDATLEEVRLAYKRLAKKFHPDANPEDPLAEQGFKKIQEAYQHLNSTTKISRLKSRLSHIKALSSSSIKKWKLEKARVSTVKPKSRARENLDLHLTLTVQERVLEHGGKERFQFVYEKPCEKCRGRGGSRASVSATCKKCVGLGFFEIERGAMRWAKTCDVCYGKGFEVLSPCESCAGKGKVSERQAVEIHVPSGVDLHQEVCLKGLGHTSFDGSRRGDLYLTLHKKVPSSH